MDNLYKYVLEKVNDARFEIIRKKSNLAHLDFENNSIDAIYIDGNHSYEAVMQDIKYWSPKVKRGGLIIGDDYLSFEGVEKAVKDSFSNFNEFGNTWFVEK
ncbi:class I SAM-dependent methyltransferase [Acidimicrobiia bacterium]|nr:class I SAM-dependent methyltransferase [Acidimicrobiia bacterium]